MDGSSAISHRRAAAEFARQARERYDDAIVRIVLYGSVARGDHRGVRSDVDLLVVLRDDVEKRDLEERLRDLAYTIELDHAIVLSLLILVEREYDARQGRQFFRNVRHDAEVLYG